MIRQTGGVAVGEISTRSRFFSRASLSASYGGRIPICCPSSSITRISRARMRSLVRIKRLSIRSSVHRSNRKGIENYSTEPQHAGGSLSSQDHLLALTTAPVGRKIAPPFSSSLPQVNQCFHIRTQGRSKVDEGQSRPGNNHSPITTLG